MHPIYVAVQQSPACFCPKCRSLNTCSDPLPAGAACEECGALLAGQKVHAANELAGFYPEPVPESVVTAPLRAIEVDDHAIRHGEPARCWIIVLCVAEGGTHSDVHNKSFDTLEAAIEHAATIHVAWSPIVKAIR